MSAPPLVIKTRHLLGQLGAHGLQASRVTGVAEGPDAVLLSEDGRVWLVTIWTGDDLQPSLLENGMGCEALVARVLAWRGREAANVGLEPPALVVLAPALASTLATGGSLSGVRLLGRKECGRAGALAEAILTSETRVFPASEQAIWRAAAVPEVRIDGPGERRRMRTVRVPEALVAPMLLDYRQERCVRLDVEDEVRTRNLGGDLRFRVITGVAGCGKTLVLMHRARLLAKLFPRKRIVLVSFNRPLTNDLKLRLARHPEAARVECLTFNQWLYKIRPPAGEFMTPSELRWWVEEERRGWPELGKQPVDWIIEELHWMLDQGLVGEAYLSAPRKGRRSRISLDQRRCLLQLLRRFRDHLRRSGRADWSEWPLSVFEDSPASLRRWPMDHLLIDEAQFFAPVWIELLRMGLRPGGHIFLCADPTQGFLRRGTSWSSLGIDVRSRSLRLEQPYRSTRAILEFAGEFYRARLPAEEEPLNLPEAAALETLEEGEPPWVQGGGSGQEQMERVACELAALRERGVPLEDVLILIAGRTVSEAALVQHLGQRLGVGSAVSVKDLELSVGGTGAAGVAHLMAATGLERPIVFLLMLDELAEEEENPMLRDEERAERVVAHTRQIYVGLTRAMKRVVLYSEHPRFREAFGAGAAEENQFGRSALPGVE
jgi:hypothetical protein